MNNLFFQILGQYLFSSLLCFIKNKIIMSDYKCIKPFFSINGRQYSYGKEIGTVEYYTLPPSEQQNFTRTEARSSDSYSSSSRSDDTSWMPQQDISSSWDAGSDSSSSSDSSSFDFGGGDTGGGGASGDW